MHSGEYIWAHWKEDGQGSVRGGTYYGGGTYHASRGECERSMESYKNYDGDRRFEFITGCYKVETTPNERGQAGYYAKADYIRKIYVPPEDTRVYRYEGTVSKPDTREYKYRGTVTRPESDTRTYRTDYTSHYSGTVNKPASDTRTWRQDYSGTVYGPWRYYYKYDTTINYIQWIN